MTGSELRKHFFSVDKIMVKYVPLKKYTHFNIIYS